MSKATKRQDMAIPRPRRITAQQMSSSLRADIVRAEDYVAAHGPDAVAKVGISSSKNGSRTDTANFMAGHFRW